ncbi:glycosyltransferase [Desulfogranum japonicum]|uniref:glycosyltransferase n=1 Tax=Desulfogranum japonicum TaxID=231447 RepID=UPI0004129BD1|nr:glycosyltransferase [Desulfogranum japonicum]
MKFEPKISIVIPVYNGFDYLSDAIDSALAQTYSNFEVIVVNDGSLDDGKTEAVAKSYGEKIRYLWRENGGVATALNLAIENAEGDYISWLSHDDIYPNDKLSTQVRFLENCQDRKIILYGDAELIDSGGNHLGRYTSNPFPQHELLFRLIEENFISGCATLIPKECFEKVGNFAPQWRFTQDYEMWFRMGRHYQFVYVPEIFVKTRIHSEQGTARNDKKHYKEVNDLIIHVLETVSIEEIFQNIRPVPVQKAKCYMKIAITLKNKGRIPSAEHAVVMAKQYAEKINDASELFSFYVQLFFYRIFIKEFAWRYWLLVAKRIFRPMLIKGMLLRQKVKRK